ncbi:MAG: RQC domain-containing protein [Alkaliphilus sp.]
MAAYISTLRKYTLEEIRQALMDGLGERIPHIAELLPLNTSLRIGRKGTLLIEKDRILIPRKIMMRYKPATLIELSEIVTKDDCYKHIKKYFFQLENAPEKRLKAANAFYEEVESLLYGHSSDENLKEIKSACEEAQISFSEKGLAIEGRSIKEIDESHLFNQQVSLVSEAIKKTNLEIPPATKNKAERAAQEKHSEIKMLLGELEPLDEKTQNLLKYHKRRTDYNRYYYLLQKISACKHNNLTTAIGRNGIEVSCQNCSLVIAYHAKLGYRQYPLFSPRSITIKNALARVVLAKQEAKLGEILRQNCAEIIPQMEENLQKLQEEIDPFLLLFEEITSQVNALEGYLREVRNGIVTGRSKNKSLSFFVQDQKLPDLSAASTLNIYDNMISNCRNKAKNMLTERTNFSASPADVVEIIVAIKAFNKTYGAGTFVKLLTGSRDKKLTQKGLSKSAYFGRLSHYKQKDIAEIIEFLIRRGIIEVRLMFRHDLPILAIPKHVYATISKKPRKTYIAPDNMDTRFREAIHNNNHEVLRQMCEKEFAYELYLEASKILSPTGKAGKMAKAVLNHI